MQEFIQLVGELANQPNATSLAYQQVDNFHKLIIDQLPYGQIDPKGLVQGLIEIDGPAQTPPNGKKPLQWYFGGSPYEVCKAIRIQYSYQKNFDGNQYQSNGSLFIGYVLDQPYSSVLASMASKAIAPASRTDLRNTLQELGEALQREYANCPSTVTALAKYVDDADFDAFIDDGWPFRAAPAMGGGRDAKLGPAPTPLSRALVKEPKNGLPGARIEFDGPARFYDSHKPFPYTATTLFNDASGIYDKLIWWYFGGRAFRITKAMKLEYFNEAEDIQGSLLVGYQGPSIP